MSSWNSSSAMIRSRTNASVPEMRPIASSAARSAAVDAGTSGESQTRMGDADAGGAGAPAGGGNGPAAGCTREVPPCG